MSVAQFAQTDYLTQSGTAYPLQIDANFAVLQQIGAQFAPHAAATANMTILVDAGTIVANGNVVVVAQQATPAFTAPTGNPRIDRVVVSQSNGAVSVITGTPAATPAAPAIPSGYLPCAQVLLQTTTSAIADSMITDERTPGAGLGTAAYQPIGTSGAAVPLLDTANSWSGAQSFLDAGVVVGAPTGGALGAGSLNAQSLAVNGVTVPSTGTANTWSAQQSFADILLAPGMAASGAQLVLQNDTVINCTNLAGTAQVPLQAAPATTSTQLIQLGQTLASLSGGNGYLELPIWTGGALQTLILQWATGSDEAVSADSSLDVTLDWNKPFPHACLFALGATLGGVVMGTVSGYNASDATFVLFNPTNSTETAQPIAIGIGY